MQSTTIASHRQALNQCEVKFIPEFSGQMVGRSVIHLTVSARSPKSTHGHRPDEISDKKFLVTAESTAESRGSFVFPQSLSSPFSLLQFSLQSYNLW